VTWETNSEMQMQMRAIGIGKPARPAEASVGGRVAVDREVVRKIMSGLNDRTM